MQKDVGSILSISRVAMGQHVPAPVPRWALPPIIRSSCVMSTSPVEEVAYSIEGVLEGSFAWQPSIPLERSKQEESRC
jgi:hypothetical protein